MQGLYREAAGRVGVPTLSSGSRYVVGVIWRQYPVHGFTTPLKNPLIQQKKRVMIFRMKGAIHHLELTAPANSSLELAAGSCELITTPTHESALIHDEACHAFSTLN